MILLFKLLKKGRLPCDLSLTLKCYNNIRNQPPISYESEADLNDKEQMQNLSVSSRINKMRKISMHRM